MELQDRLVVPVWEFTEFPYPACDYASVATFMVDADSEFTRQFLLEPLPFLVENIEEMTMDWTVSIQRINANMLLPGPRKCAVCVFTICELQTAYVLVYRIPQD